MMIWCFTFFYFSRMTPCTSVSDIMSQAMPMMIPEAIPDVELTALRYCLVIGKGRSMKVTFKSSFCRNYRRKAV